MEANRYTISQGISKWSAKIEITGHLRAHHQPLFSLCHFNVQNKVQQKHHRQKNELFFPIFTCRLCP